MAELKQMSKTPEQIQVMLDFVLLNAEGSMIGLFESMEEIWIEKKYLTEKQIASLEKNFNKLREGT